MRPPRLVTPQARDLQIRIQLQIQRQADLQACESAQRKGKLRSDHQHPALKENNLTLSMWRLRHRLRPKLRPVLRPVLSRNRSACAPHSARQWPPLKPMTDNQ